jgi:hypothetical protein
MLVHVGHAREQPRRARDACSRSAETPWRCARAPEAHRADGDHAVLRARRRVVKDRGRRSCRAPPRARARCCSESASRSAAPGSRAAPRRGTPARSARAPRRRGTRCPRASSRTRRAPSAPCGRVAQEHHVVQHARAAVDHELEAADEAVGGHRGVEREALVAVAHRGAHGVVAREEVHRSMLVGGARASGTPAATRAGPCPAAGSACRSSPTAPPRGRRRRWAQACPRAASCRPSSARRCGPPADRPAAAGGGRRSRAASTARRTTAWTRDTTRTGAAPPRESARPTPRGRARSRRRPRSPQRRCWD